MYEILDETAMSKVKSKQIRQRQKPNRDYGGVILLRFGTKLDLLPEDSTVKRNADGYWEAHITIKDKEIIKNLAKTLDAIAYI